MTYQKIIEEQKEIRRNYRLQNLSLFLKRRHLFNNRKGARVGDYLQLPDGTYTRFTHLWTDANNKPTRIQTGGISNSAGYYLGDGYISYSGSLNPGIEYNFIEQIKEIKPGLIWFFRENYMTADNAVYYKMNFRVFKIKDEFLHKTNYNDL